MTVRAWYWSSSVSPETEKASKWCGTASLTVLSVSRHFSDLRACCEWSSWARSHPSQGPEGSGPAFSFWLGHCPVLFAAPPPSQSHPGSIARLDHLSSPPGPRTPDLPTVARMNHEACRRWKGKERGVSNFSLWLGLVWKIHVNLKESTDLA